MKKIRTAVVGAGYLGKFHAQKYAALDASELRAVVDLNAAAAQSVAAQCGARHYTDYHAILGEVDAVSIVTPAAAHYEIARDCLRAGVDVLVEKPITLEVGQARELIDLAADRGRILQVGHLERFNPATLKLEQVVRDPLFIESHRIAPFKPRGTDVDVLLDLMIHDIDLALSLVGREVLSVEACGAPVLSDHVDIANARIHFEGGCVANVTASRISLKSERKMRFFQRDAYVSADFHTRQVGVYRRVPKADGGYEIAQEQFQLDGDALRAEIESFLHCVGTRSQPKVGGEDGRRALAAALKVRAAMSRFLATTMRH
ncbi:MAG: Gfo/Idh/MocA family oxidoreductase [Gammaproteobacteria bacterium]|nr:Gfo/Idh/MocA family oxidoreductase [Gammaproteobacteria bacterium]